MNFLYIPLFYALGYGVSTLLFQWTEPKEGWVCNSKYASIWPVTFPAFLIFFVNNNVKYLWSKFGIKSKDKKKQVELEDMAIYHFFTYPEKWSLDKSYKFYKSWTNSNMNVSIFIPKENADADSKGKLVFGNDYYGDNGFNLSFHNLSKMKKQREIQESIAKYNGEQAMKLRLQNKIHDTKDKLWSELQQRAQKQIESDVQS